MGSSDVKKRKLFDDPSFALVPEVATPPTLSSFKSFWVWQSLFC